ncbi:hypothetical protein V1277_006280 [Bradyrhizobium sp. AZCC 1588]|uniref:hypothetical protein n=1 Tax=unclassified Bradyrhizobium TaxID=2631580 RepID=UPI002FF323EB
MNDDQLAELMNRASTHTPIQRLSHAEQRVVFRWLADNGYITFTDSAAGLERAPQRQKAHAYTTEGKPVWKR